MPPAATPQARRRRRRARPRPPRRLRRNDPGRVCRRPGSLCGVRAHSQGGAGAPGPGPCGSPPAACRTGSCCCRGGGGRAGEVSGVGRAGRRGGAGQVASPLYTRTFRYAFVQCFCTRVRLYPVQAAQPDVCRMGAAAPSSPPAGLAARAARLPPGFCCVRTEQQRGADWA